MSAASLLEKNPNPSGADVDSAMSGNICRCGCYVRIKEAILKVGDASMAYNAATKEVKA
jgi:isoquinoline 1-oxidoreductase alpha subunit